MQGLVANDALKVGRRSAIGTSSVGTASERSGRRFGEVVDIT